MPSGFVRPARGLALDSIESEYPVLYRVLVRHLDELRSIWFSVIVTHRGHAPKAIGGRFQRIIDETNRYTGAKVVDSIELCPKHHSICIRLSTGRLATLSLYQLPIRAQSEFWKAGRSAPSKHGVDLDRDDAVG